MSQPTTRTEHTAPPIYNATTPAVHLLGNIAVIVFDTVKSLVLLCTVGQAPLFAWLALESAVLFQAQINISCCNIHEIQR